MKKKYVAPEIETVSVVLMNMLAGSFRDNKYIFNLKWDSDGVLNAEEGDSDEARAKYGSSSLWDIDEDM